jgi:hypothetical protein
MSQLAALISKKAQELAGAFNDNHRQYIYAVVEEVTAEAAEGGLIEQLMPPVDVPAATLEIEYVTGSGGLTGERVLGAPGQSVSGPSSTSGIFKPGAYQDVTKLTEEDLLMLRKLGTLGDRGVTGLTGGELNWLERLAVKHKKRLKNRMAQLGWTALTAGTWTWQGRTITFPIPEGNIFSAATDWTQPGVGTPFEDLIQLLEQNAFFIKYRPLIKALAINPISAAYILQRALEAKVITNNNITSAGINEVKRFMAPGLPDFVVVDDAYQNETYAKDGSVTLGNAEYMFPSNVVMPIVDFSKAKVLFTKYGELQLTENMNAPEATVEKPAQGIYTFIDERGMLERKAPYIELVTGFNGAPNLMRYNDVILINF